VKIDCNIDSTALILRLRKGERRLAYAAVNAINKTAKRIQAEERRQLAERFTLRKTEFMQRMAAVIKPFASVKQGRAFAEISVGQKPKLLLSAFERGGEREPLTPGAQKVAVPVVGGPARPQFAQPVVPEFRISRLRFDRTKTGRRRAGVVRTRTYLVPSTGIFQRTGPEPEDTTPVYLFAEDQKLDARLGFIETARRIARRWFKEEMERETVNAIARSKGQGI